MAKLPISKVFQKNAWSITMTGDFGVALNPMLLDWWHQASVARVQPFSEEDKARQLPL